MKNTKKIEFELKQVMQQQQQLIFKLGLDTYNFLDAAFNLKGQIADVEAKRKKLAKKLPTPKTETPKK